MVASGYDGTLPLILALLGRGRQTLVNSRPALSAEQISKFRTARFKQ